MPHEHDGRNGLEFLKRSSVPNSLRAALAASNRHRRGAMQKLASAERTLIRTSD
jgi:hypothetical protein